MFNINSSVVLTAYTDLKAIQRLILNLQENKEFTCTHVYSLMKDICLIIDEVIKAFFSGSIEIDERVNKIRNRIHLYIKKRGKNQKIYREILDYHINAYGEDMNNIGFYLNDKEEVVGSTLYISYILLNTGNLPFPSLEDEAQQREQTLSFAKYIGGISVLLSQLLEKTFGVSLPKNAENIEKIDAEKSYECRDINHNALFSSDNDMTNTFILRLIFSLQEINDVIWLSDRYMTKLQNPMLIDSYILLRLTTLKTDEILDNLLNIRKYSKKQFIEWNNKSDGKVERLIDKYEREIKTECSKMRNMIHYEIDAEDDERSFVGYLASKINQESNYSTSLINTIKDIYLQPLKYEILEFLEIEKIKPLSDWEMIINRLSKLFKGS